MVFKRKKFSTTTEILDLMKADDEIMRSTAVFYFHRSDKVSGKIYLRKGVEPGLVYAAHVSNMPFHIGKRIKPLIEPEEYEEILRQVGGDDTDPSIARLAVAKQLVGEKVVDAFIREYLFAAASEIFSWTEVIGRWEIGTETRDFASRHYIGLELLQKKAAERDVQYAEMISDTKLPEENVDELKVLRKGSIADFDDIENRNLMAIVELADGRHTIKQVKEETGLLKIPAFLGIHALWTAGRIQLLAGDIPIYPPSVFVEEEPKEVVSDEVSEPIDFSAEEIEEETTVEEPASKPVETAPVIEKPVVEEPLVEEETPVVEEETASATEGTFYFEEPEAVSVVEEYEEPDFGISHLPAPLDNNFDIEEFTAQIEEEPADKPNEEVKVSDPIIYSNTSVFDKLYTRIAELQKEVSGSEERVKASELEVRKIDVKIKALEAQLSGLNAEKEIALKNHEAVVSSGKSSQEKLEKILASLDNLTAG